MQAARRNAICARERGLLQVAQAVGDWSTRLIAQAFMPGWYYTAPVSGVTCKDLQRFSVKFIMVFNWVWGELLAAGTVVDKFSF